MKGINKLVLCHAEMIQVVSLGLVHRVFKVGNHKITKIAENKTGGHSKFEITLEETKEVTK